MHSFKKTLVRASLIAILVIAGASFTPSQCQAGFVPTLKLEQEDTTKAKPVAQRTESKQEAQAYGNAETTSRVQSANTSAQG